MPTFNRRHLLDATLATVFSQDSPTSDWHLTVVDNASTDGTVEYLAECKKRWTNFDYVVNPHNLGLFGNLNRCMDLAQTRKYMVIHSDDFVSGGLISSVSRFIEANPAVQMCFGNCRVMLEETGEILPRWYDLDAIANGRALLDRHVLLETLLSSTGNFIFAPTVVYDRDFFGPSLRYSEEYAVTADLDLWFRVAMRDPIVGFISESNITCKIHAQRMSHSHASCMRLEAIQIFRHYLKLVSEGGSQIRLGTATKAFIRMRLSMLEAAIKAGLIPSFSTRRKIYALLDAMTRQLKRIS